MHHLFGWECYEASGGLGDYIGSYETIKEAKQMAQDNRYSTIHIIKEQKGKLVLIVEGYGEHENDNPPIIPAPKDWDWGKFIIDWELA